jgi:hypothetical protein
VVKAAVGNSQSGKEVMMLLLEKRGAEVQITEEVVKAAVRNSQSGKEVMMLSEGNSQSGKNIMMLLLEKRAAEIPVTEEVLIEIAKNCDHQVMMVLLEKRGAEIQITEEVPKASVGNWRSGALSAAGMFVFLFSLGLWVFSCFQTMFR